MADDNDKGIVLKGPWKRVKTVKKSQTEKISNDMAFAEDVAESVMIPMIHGLSENGVDIKSDNFVAEIGFINEIVKAIMYRNMRYPHPMNQLIETVMSTKKESVEDVYSKFDYEKIEDMLDSLKKDDEEDDK
tara:strand:+ start:67 stop:462 length:396 start_codon:yes stop_codon:yes gene_type:complete